MRKKIRKRKSTWIAAIGGILGVGEAMLPYMTNIVPQGALAIMSILFIGGSFIVRKMGWGEYDD